MLRLNQSQRMLLADKLFDAANLAAGALVFGQLLSQSFSVALALVGLGIWVVLSVWSLALSAKRDRW